MAQDIRGMKSACASLINMVGTIMKDRYQKHKAGLKIMLVCFHLTISKMTMAGSVGHVLNYKNKTKTPLLYHVCLYFLSAAAVILLGILEFHSFEKKLTRKIKVSNMHVRKDLNQRVRRIGE